MCYGSSRASFRSRAIGDALYITRDTVKSHTKAVYRKLGVSSREEAVALA